MKSFAVFRGSTGTPLDASAYPSRDVVVDGLPLRAAVLDLDASPAPLGDREVRVRVGAFSCNYRDKGLLAKLAYAPPSRFFVVGSEFAGRVVAVGAAVRRLRVGDRVVSNHHFTGAGVDADGVPEGIVTNHASRELQTVHENKLLALPDAMTDAEAAAFSLGAQTAYSMVRRVGLARGTRALVTAARSNTSLFVIQALAGVGVEVHALTSRAADAERLRAAGATLVVVSEHALDAQRAALEPHVGAGYDGVFDPFFDAHLELAVEALAPCGAYITCGFVSQSPGAASEAGLAPLRGEAIMARAMIKNITLMGNCIGHTADLERALLDFEGGRLRPVVDSVYGLGQAEAFLERTYTSRERFGKVVFAYDA